MIILFFSNNLNPLNGGLELENIDEINEIKNSLVQYILFPYDYLEYILNIVNSINDINDNDINKDNINNNDINKDNINNNDINKDDINNNKIIIYIDFCNSPINLLNYLNNLNFLDNIKIILKYKGYKLNDNIINFIKRINNVNILTTINQKQITELTYKYNINFIRYWRIKLIPNPKLSYYLNYNPIFNSLKNIKNTFKFIFVGRKDNHKQINLIVKLFNELKYDIELLQKDSFKKNKLKDISLILIGKENIEIKYDNNTNIINFPVLDYESTLYIIKNYSDCLVVPSRSEGFGRVYIEAMSYNKVSLIPENSMFADLIKEINPNTEIIIKTNIDNEYNTNININKNEINNDIIERNKNIKNTMLNVYKYYDEIQKECINIFNILKEKLTQQDLIETINK